MSMLPPARPRQERSETQAILDSHGILDNFALVGIRGYYRQTMGDSAKNDRGIYDDAIILITPTAHVTFNANVDPSAFRKGMANLKPGVWQYKLGMHRGLYKALVQAGKVTVARDGQADETGFFGINIHKGSTRSTSSLGCQTIPPPQWPGFIALVESELKRHGRKTLPYVLV